MSHKFKLTLPTSARLFILINAVKFNLGFNANVI